MGVDEARRDHVTVAPHHHVARFRGHRAHCDDPTVDDCHVAGMACPTENDPVQSVQRTHGVQSANVSIINRTSGPSG